MKDLLREVKELEAAIEHAEQVADSHADTVLDCACALEHRQLAAWLTELLEIKNARLAAEVFMEQHPMQTIEVPEEPMTMRDLNKIMDRNHCPTCGWEGGLQEERGDLKCPSCGRRVE